MGQPRWIQRLHRQFIASTSRKLRQSHARDLRQTEGPSQSSLIGTIVLIETIVTFIVMPPIDRPTQQLVRAPPLAA